MTKPVFRYTSTIVNNLVEITSSREVIINSYLVPKWEVALRREALVKATHASTAIEGNPLTLEEVSELAKGRKITSIRKAKQEVLNYLGVLKNIDRYPENGKITEKCLLRIHKDITKNTLENLDWEERYRNIPVVVGNRATGEVIFEPPPADKVPELMKDFISWLNSGEASELHPVLVAGIAHYWFVWIHPFVDGNGRTARALATLILYLRGFDIKRFFALDDYYDSDRKAYYDALNSVNQKMLDITVWLEYFTEGVRISITKVKERVLQLSIENIRKTEKGQIALTERQMKIIEFIHDNGKITSGDAAEMFKISRQAALKEMSKLVDAGVLRPVGRGRGAHYVLA